MCDCEHIFAHFESQTLKKRRIGAEYFVEIYPQNGVSWYIGRLLVKPSMDINIVLNHEANVPKAVDVGQLVPIRGISVIDVQGHGFAHLVAPTPDYHQQSADEQTPMLIALSRFGVVAIGGPHPIQPTVSMLPQPPSIIERGSVTPPAAKDNHHATGRPRAADAGRVINPGGWVLSPSVYFLPNAISGNIDFPDIPHCLRASVAAIDDDVGLEVGHDVAVAGARGGALAVLDLPVGLVSDGQEVELVEVVVGQLPSPQGPPEDVEEVVDGEGVVGCAVCGRDAVIIEFLPLPEVVVEEEGVPRDDVLAGVPHRPSEQDRPVLADGRDGVPETSRRAVSSELCLLHCSAIMYSNH